MPGSRKEATVPSVKTRRMRHDRYVGSMALAATCVCMSLGCAVPQPPGRGRCDRLVEPETRTSYWLYLPEDYVKNGGRHPTGELWPIVLTLHGLKPYDTSNRQIRSWQEEADRFRYIVIAPNLRTCDSLTMQYPLRDNNLSYVKKDEVAVLAVLDEVCRLTNGDPQRVMITSFSSGGFLAHYLMNRFPDRFHCLTLLGSNFSEELLADAQVPKYRHVPVAIFFGENDFKDCLVQSMEAYQWYRQRGFDVQIKSIANLGHERRPQTAAAFFASVIGVQPKTPPDFSNAVLQDVSPSEIARYTSQGGKSGSAGSGGSRDDLFAERDRLHNQGGAADGSPVDRNPGYAPHRAPETVAPLSTGPRNPPAVRSSDQRGPTPKRPVPGRPAAP